MTRVAYGSILLLVSLLGCASDNLTPPPQTAPPREPVTADLLRSRWQALAEEEAEVVHALDEMGKLAADARMQKLQRARDGAAFVQGGLGSLTPPTELKPCHEMGAKGANELRAALDGISDLWMGRTSGDRRAESIRLADAVCVGAGKLAAGRSACGVTAQVPVPAACQTQ
jgi:hypothetical protein